MSDSFSREIVALIVTIWFLYIASFLHLKLEVIILYFVIKLWVDISSK